MEADTYVTVRSVGPSFSEQSHHHTKIIHSLLLSSMLAEE